MNHKRKKPSEPREFGGTWRIDGLLRKEDDAKKAAFDDSGCSPKPKTRYYESKKRKRLGRKKVCCRRCGFYMGMVEVAHPYSWWNMHETISKKFGTWYVKCDSCKKKDNAS